MAVEQQQQQREGDFDSRKVTNLQMISIPLHGVTTFHLLRNVFFFIFSWFLIPPNILNDCNIIIIVVVGGEGGR